MSRTVRISLLLPILVALFLCMGLPGAVSEEAAPAKKIAKLDFGKWYKPVDFKVEPKMASYPRPLDDALLEPFEDRLTKGGTSKSDIVLQTNGFVVTPNGRIQDVAAFYKGLNSQNIPMFVTADTVLHLFHVMFSKTLADIEEGIFYADMIEMTGRLKADLQNMLTAELQKRGETNPNNISPDSLAEQALWLATGYMDVIRALLEGSWTSARTDVQKELSLIQAKGGFSESALFKYKEDYSQYEPRGHYTKSEVLQRYFRALMYAGRMSFLIKGKVKESDNALVDLKTAKIQTLAALFLADKLMNTKMSETYGSIYATTSFFVGHSDDITPFEYSGILKETGMALPNALDDKAFMDLQVRVLELMPPAIYGGTGNIEAIDLKTLKGEPSPELLEKSLEVTIGMRLMGQRFIVDGYVMGRMCWPTVGDFTGTGTPFTNAPDRTRSSAMDFMSVLGSPQARQILAETQMDKYKGYADIHNKLQAELKALSPEDWRRNLYMGTLDVIRSLFTSYKERQPFQANGAWEYRQLLSGLGSWTGLRHDTILYAKQPYGELKGMGRPQAPPKAIAYVEPEPELFARLASLTGMILNSLGELGLRASLSEEVRERLVGLQTMAMQLLSISIKQLEQKELSAEELEYLEKLPVHLARVQGKDEDDFNPAIVADVFTDTNTQTVVETGTGPMDTIVVVWALPDGRIDVAIGAVYSWYEFAMPMTQRLTDEKWREKLKNSPPARPGWMKHFMKLAGPLPEDRF